MIITKSELFTAYNKAKAQARRAGDTKRIDRLNKALGILQSKNYYTGEKVAYIPTPQSCGCKDWKYRNAKNRAYTGPCKHMLAESLLQAIKTARNVTEILNIYAESAVI